jgi:hypothetical protein
MLCKVSRAKPSLVALISPCRDLSSRLVIQNITKSLIELLNRSAVSMNPRK